MVIDVEQSSAVHIQASYWADVILPASSSKLRLLVINLAPIAIGIPGRQLVNSQLHKASNVVRHIKRHPTLRHLFLIFLFLPSIAFGQKSKKAKEKSKNDSLYKMTLQMMDRFNLDSIGYHGLIRLDTVFYDDNKIKSIGSFAIDRNNEKSDYKIGKWIEYYESGQVKSIGDYQISYVMACRSAMPGLAYYSYKISSWTYYYVNGQVMATGKYELEKQKVFTGIADQFAKKSVVSNNWLFYDSNGQIASDKPKIIADLDKVE